jgi:mono/diheme cytochrome c family protein
MHHRWASVKACCGRPERLLGAVVLAGLLATGAAQAANAPTSNCVVCHTDAEKLKAEAAKVPAPPASALQAGKG